VNSKIDTKESKQGTLTRNSEFEFTFTTCKSGIPSASIEREKRSRVKQSYTSLWSKGR